MTAGATPLALPLAIMHANVARSHFSSCQTRRIRAKLFRRVHWLLLLLFHAYSMPMNACFFKPLPFHQLMGFYHTLQDQCLLLPYFRITKYYFNCIISTYRINAYRPTTRDSIIKISYRIKNKLTIYIKRKSITFSHNCNNIGLP